MTARGRLDAILDPGWAEQDATLASADPLGWPGYDPPPGDSVVAASGSAGGHAVEAVAFDFAVFGGSMGVVAGETVARAFERAVARRAAVVVLTASGGARMQEGMPALAQMASTVSARAGLAEAGLPFVAWLGDPTTGGVYASFASLADLVWAEPRATIGFAGPRVAERVTGRPLPAGSHTAEFAFEHGLVDRLVALDELPSRLREALGVLMPREPAPRPEHRPGGPVSAPGATPDPWREVQAARDAARPAGAAIARMMLRPLVEIAGDRAGADDAGVLTGFGELDGATVAVVALTRTPPSAAGYRKARRLLEIAGRMRRPLVTFVDTPGADPSSESEAQGIAGEIARMFEAMLAYPARSVAVVTGEGGSGGALAFAAASKLLILRHAIFSVIGPEGAAAILRRDDVAEVAALQKLTSSDLERFGLADAVVDETPDWADNARTLATHVAAALHQAGGDSVTERRLRWRHATQAFVT